MSRRYFKQNNFLTLGCGKTFHPNLPPNFDEPSSWSQEMPYFPLIGQKCNSDKKGPGTWPDAKIVTPASDKFCGVEAPDETFFDWMAANYTIVAMNLAKSTSRPFAFFTGFRRPHVPWAFPARFWNAYPEASELGAPLHRLPPTNMPEVAYTQTAFSSATVNGVDYTYNFTTALPTNVTLVLRKAYYAAVSWTDSQIGRVLDEVEKLEYQNNTVAVSYTHLTLPTKA